MSDLKRELVKYIRDYIKKDYKLRDCCYVCSITSNLELHHLYSVSELFSLWCTKNGIRDISTETEIKTHRVQFAIDYAEQLSHDNLFTLCGKHHKQLHNLYGQTYSNNMVPKIKNWIELQKVKHGS
jgi:5-methylcytosine-specific restriction endonuclease McrA